MSDVASADHPIAGPPGNGRTARFGIFELDFRSGELRRDGIRIPLQDQPFRLLSFLIERAGDVVTRDELRERLWPSEFVDFDHGLNTAIRKLRTALDDSADNPRFIETLARRGYRFIAPVAWNGAEGTVPVPGRESSSRRSLVIAAAIALLAVIAFAYLANRTTSAPPVPDDQIWAVAVLPFTYRDPATEHLGDGLTEVLIDTLARIPDVRVMATTTVFRYKGQHLDPKKIGAELDVGAVVIGDIRQEGDRYRIRVEMVDVRDGSRLWGDRLDIPLSDLPAAQSRISDDLTNHLRHGKRGPGAYTRNAEAYELYLKGLHAWNQRGKANIRESVDYFARAADLDPTFSAAYAGLANAWGVMIGSGVVSPEEGTPKVMAAARRALELDPNSAEAYTSMATTKFRNLWDFEGAEADYRRALAINPNYATGHQWYSDYLRAMGRFDEARREIDAAYRIDPLARAVTGTKCHSLNDERKYREAIAFVNRVAEFDERQRSVPCLISSYAALGEFDQVTALLEQNGLDGAAAAYRKSGERGLYEKRLELLFANQKDEYHYPVDIAETYALLGNYDEAFRWLEIAFKHRVSRLTSFQLSYAFDGMRDDPRFDDLRRRIGLPRVNPPAAS